MTEQRNQVLSPTWRGRLDQELSTREIRFLMHSFGCTSTYFFGFGLMVFALNAIITHVSSTSNSFLLYVLLAFFAVGGAIASLFGRRKWDMNPLAVTKGFTTGMHAILTVTFVSAFLMLLRIFDDFAVVNAAGNKLLMSGFLVGVSFGAAWLFYLIPVFVAWFFMSRKQAVTLNRFMSRIAIGYLCGIIALGTSFLLGFGTSAFSSLLLMVIGLLVLIMVIVSPFVTLYRFKVTAYAINYDNEEEVEKWKSYFIYIMLEQLLVLALRIMHIIIRTFAKR